MRRRSLFLASITSAVLLLVVTICWLPSGAQASGNDTVEAADATTTDVANSADACSLLSKAGADLRHWATLELRGVPVFLHQRLDRKGHFLIEPLMSLPDLAGTLNASCVRLDRLTGRYYVSFPVVLYDDEVLFQAKQQLQHLSPKSVTFMRLTSAELLSTQLPGGWSVESFRISSEGRLGYLRVNCLDHLGCVTLRAQLLRHEVGIFERVLLRIGAAAADNNCVTIGNLTKQVAVPHASQLDMAAFIRRKVPGNCSQQAMIFFREYLVSGHPVFVMREVGADGEEGDGSDEDATAAATFASITAFWLEPLLTFDGNFAAFRNASGWPGLSLRLHLREPTVRTTVASRLRLLSNGGTPLRFLHLVDYRLERSGLAGLGIEQLRLSSDRESAYLRLMAPNDTAAGAEVLAELGRAISTNPTLLFDALRFNFSFSPDDACQAPYWVERRVATPHRGQYRVSELQRRYADRTPCYLSKQPQVEKIARYRGMPVVLWQRLDRPAVPASRDILIEPLMFYEDKLSVQFDYTRGAHFVSLNVTMRSPEATEAMKRNLTYLQTSSVEFMQIRELNLRPPANLSGVAAVEFYLTGDQRDGFLRLYCHSLAACAGLKNYLKFSEMLLERLQINITMATPDREGCSAPEPIAKLIVARSHQFDLAYLREKSTPRLVCDDAAYPLIQAPLQPAGSCQLVVQRSVNHAGNYSYFVEPAFCFRGADREFDYVDGRSFLRLRLSLTNTSLIPELRQTLAAPVGTTTVDFMELRSLRVAPRTRLPGLTAGAFKASFDKSEAEFRVYCDTSDICWKLHTHLLDNNTVMLENFNLEMTAALPSYDCWMPRPMQKLIGSPNSTYFDLSYLNSKTHQLPGCPKELPIALFALKVIDGCPTFVYRREDTKAGFYVEPQFCFNGQVQYGYNYVTSSHYVSFGVDLNRASVLATVASQLADLAPKRVAFLEVRRANLSLSLARRQPEYLLDGFAVTVDRGLGAFRFLCASETACKELGSNVTAQPWILLERIQVESLMANGIDCELSTFTRQQPSSADVGGFSLPIDMLKLKLPTIGECKATETPQPYQVLTVDGCPVVVYRLPAPEKADSSDALQRDLLIEPLFCFHGNNATGWHTDYLAGEEYVSIRLLLQSHAVLKAVQDQLSLTPGAGSLQFARPWAVQVVEETAFETLRVTRVGVSPDQLTAEMRVACRGRMCDALIETLAAEPADYLKSIALSVTSLLPAGRCHFRAPATKRPITIGYSRSSQCGLDYLPTTTTTTTVPPRVSFQHWITLNCDISRWTSCQLGSSGTVAYFFSRQSTDWHSARSRCQQSHGDLATINSSSENNEVTSHLQSDSWIGMLKSSYSFMWFGSSYPSYTNFRSTDSGYGDCVAMSLTQSWNGNYYGGRGEWTKRYCHSAMLYVCKVQMHSVIGF